MADDKGRIVWFDNHVMHVDFDHALGRKWSIIFLGVVIDKLKKQKGTTFAVNFMENMLRVLKGKFEKYQFPMKLDDLHVCYIKQTEEGDVVAEQEKQEKQP